MSILDAQSHPELWEWVQHLADADVCYDCYMAHHYGAYPLQREATEREVTYWLNSPSVVKPGLQSDSHGLQRELMGLYIEDTVRHAEAWIDGRADDPVIVTEWFVGDDRPARCEGGEPLSKLPDDLHVSDWTYDPDDADRQLEIEVLGTGVTDFSYTACHGCGCRLGGSRYRLAIHHPKGDT